MIDHVALDRAVRRCRMLLHLCRVHGIDDGRDVRTLMPVVVAFYREEIEAGPTMSCRTEGFRGIVPAIGGVEGKPDPAAIKEVV